MSASWDEQACALGFLASKPSGKKKEAEIKAAQAARLKAKEENRAKMLAARAKKEFRMKAVEEVPRRKRPAASTEPKTPIEGGENILITSALPYVNNVPHLGNLIGCVLSADVYARWARQRGKNAIYICGTDEYGTATETKALEEGISPRAICDKYHAKHRAIYDWFDISFDYFGRTSTEDPGSSAGKWAQTDIAQNIYRRLEENGRLLEKEIEQVYCEGCRRFLADRFVEGTCPKCGYEDARGDQCDNCGSLLNGSELVHPRCKVDRSHTCVVRSSEHMFLDLPSLKDALEKWVDEREASGEWSSNAVHVTRAWLADGIKPRCITRDLKWGTPVPSEDPRFSSKVFYVWFDAPIGYISITANYTSEWKQWWMQPEKVSLVQFMGKDNIPFHSVIFPSSLIGTADRWTLVRKLCTTEYLNYEAGKFSKSRNVGVFGDGAMETGIPSEVWRFYLLLIRPETADSVFDWDNFADAVNAVMVSNIGNFCNRALGLAFSNYDGKVPTANEPGPAEETLVAEVNANLAEYNALLEACRLREALQAAIRISGAGNKYIQDTTPWVLLKGSDDDKKKAATIVSYACNVARLLSCVLEPFAPGFTDKFLHLVNLDHADIPDTFQITIPPMHPLPSKPMPIFSPLRPEQVAEFRARFSGGSTDAAREKEEAAAASKSSSSAAAAAPSSSKSSKKSKKSASSSPSSKKSTAAPDVPPIARIDLRVGQIVRAWHHPDADKLFCEEIDVGEDAPRQIASGLRDHYTQEQMTGRRIIVVCNLKPRPMRGFVSHGMVLCANGADGKVEFVDPPADVPIGTRVICPDFAGPPGTEPDEVVNPMKKSNPWKDIVPDIATNQDRVACYKGSPLTADGKTLLAPTLANARLS